MIKLASILKDSNYTIDLFTQKEIEDFEETIFEKNGKPYVKCLVRDKDIQLKPEEVVRQLYLGRLLHEYGYPKKLFRCEYPMTFGSDVHKKFADIVILEKNKISTVYMVIEVKKPKEKEGKEQLKSYCHSSGSSIAVWTNGSQIVYYNRKNPNYFEEISGIPKFDQKLGDILTERYTWKDLVLKDKILTEGKSLKAIILDMEDEVLANAGVDVFEELFKLIFTKLYDESESSEDKKYLERDAKRDLHLQKDESLYTDILKYKQWLKSTDCDDSDFRVLEFRNRGEGTGELKEKIQKLFEDAQEKWPGIFPPNSKIELSPSHLSVCVSSMHDIKLFNSNLQIIDEAFEYLVNKSSKGEKGQYFTPRYVIDMCVKMLNPQKGEYMIDTASGSCGFPVHTLFHLTGKPFQNADLSGEDKNTILRVFGIDFDEKAVRVARTLNLLAGDGETNVLYLNTLDYTKWGEIKKNDEWRDTYGSGYSRLRKLAVNKKIVKKKEDNKEFNFDILMSNPPFAGDIKEPNIIHHYELGFSDKQKAKQKVGRDILFIERNLDFVKPGGRLAIVLPQGRFNNTSDKAIREYIADKARILAVVGLHGNTFKPHTGTKTSVIFLQKWDNDLCTEVDDYPIFFATSEKSGKDNSGDYVYVKNEDGTKKIDQLGHFIVDHDLHNHGGEAPDGIAEAFNDFVKSEKLRFM